MDEQNTDVNSIFKDQVVRQMDRISIITISTKEDPALKLRRHQNPEKRLRRTPV